MVPAGIVYGVFALYPTLSGLLVSFTNAQGIEAGQFIGFGNYLRLLHDVEFVDALRNTIVFTLLIVVVQNVLGLGVAAWMRDKRAVRNLARVGLLLPTMMSFIIVGYIWSFIYSPLGGPLNSLLQFLHLESLQQVWLGDTRTALPAIAAASIWMYLGFTATIYLAGFLAIPPELDEAAVIDGAVGWTRFRRVHWPLLAPAVTVSVTLSIIGSLRIFELPLVMTQGGPAGATETLSQLVYNTSFSGFDFGYGTAIAFVLLVVTAFIAALVTTVLRRRELPA
jgi:ABC-type sugar transport system permease subunit